MKNFIQNIKKHWIIALICAAVFIIAVTVAVIISKSGGATGGNSQTTERTAYFEDSDYPVIVTEKQGTVFFELDGSKTADLTWETMFSDPDIASLGENAKERSGKLKAVVLPKNSGYTIVTFTRSGEISGVRYDAAKISAELYVTSDADGVLTMRCSNVYQALDTAGAADSSTPYIFDGNTVLLPNGGDWTLTYRKPDDLTMDEYYVEEGQNADGIRMFTVYPNQTVEATRDPADLAEGDMPPDDEETQAAEQPEQKTGLILRSESLGIEQQLECYPNDAFGYSLRQVEGSHEK